MKWDQLPKTLHKPIKLLADFSNATLPLSDWFLTLVHRPGGYVLVDNPATGYRIPLSRRELVGFDDERWGFPCFKLRVGLYFACPNAFFVYRNGRIEIVTSAVRVTRWS